MMTFKRNIFLVFCSVFLLFVISAGAVESKQAQITEQGTISVAASTTDSECEVKLEGIRVSINTCGNHPGSLRCYEQHKRIGMACGVGAALASSRCSYYSYLLVRVNSIGCPPLYIAYRRLII